VSDAAREFRRLLHHEMLVCGINLEGRALQRPRDRYRGDPSPKGVAHRRTDAAHARMFFFEFKGETSLTYLVECFLKFAMIGDGLLGVSGQCVAENRRTFFLRKVGQEDLPESRGMQRSPASHARGHLDMLRAGFFRHDHEVVPSQDRQMRTGTESQGQLVKYRLCLPQQPVVLEVTLRQHQDPGTDAILAALRGYFGISKLRKCFEQAADAAFLQSQLVGNLGDAERRVRREYLQNPEGLLDGEERV